MGEASRDRIDTHHHLWLLERGDYHWMPDDGPLAEDYLGDRLLPELHAAGVIGTVLVQAAATADETRFLLDLADELEPVLAVIGWVALDEPDAIHELATMADGRPLVGIRPMVHDIDDPEWIERPQVRRNLEELATTGQRFELLSRTEHLPAAYRALATVPDLPVVIDHLSKPTYNWEEDEAWRDWMQRLGERPNTYCKLSGMVTEVGRGWTVDRFQPYAEFVFEVFGTDRVMFGSDWPVCRLVAEYGEVVRLAERLTAQLSSTEASSFWVDTAVRFYDLAVPDVP